MSKLKIIVIDDDPTGSQTVHSCLLLTKWDAPLLCEALLDEPPLFFILTNTRSMRADEAKRTTRDVCQNLKQALDQLAKDGHEITPILVSRSDSTLRGHYPVETDVIAAQFGPFDAHFMIPAFIEGGRITKDSTHYQISEGKRTPVHQTEFARDAAFAYYTSYLPDYIEEKTGGHIKSDDVQRFLLADITGNCLDRLGKLQDNQCCVVDAVNLDDLDHFAKQLKQSILHGKKFLFRSGASLLTALARLAPQPVAPELMGAYVRAKQPGAVIIGSHVQKTTQQLEQLQKLPSVLSIEIDVARLNSDRKKMLMETTNRTKEAHTKGLHVAIYTSRKELKFANPQDGLLFGEQVSAFLMEVVRDLPKTLGFLVSKGGITSNDVLSKALALRTSRVLGQILPGCSVILCPQDHSLFPNLPIVIFPGNVGDDRSLVTVLEHLSPQ